MRAVGLDEPFFVARGEGAYLEDGRRPDRYVDWVQSWGPLIFGHADPETVEAVREAALARHDASARRPRREVELAAEIVDAVPVGRAGAARLLRHRGGDVARPARARRHAPRPGDQVRRLLPRPRRRVPRRAPARASRRSASPSSPGVPERRRRRHDRLPYNDVDAAAAAVERYGEGLAAIIVEPVAGNMGCRPAGARASSRRCALLCDACGALLVFDEVITGFRVARGGAQERFGVTPDLTVLGKIVGGGLPLAAFGGRAERDGAARAGGRRLPGGHAVREPARDGGRALGAAPAARPRRSTTSSSGAARGSRRASRRSAACSASARC